MDYTTKGLLVFILSYAPKKIPLDFVYEWVNRPSCEPISRKRLVKMIRQMIELGHLNKDAIMGLESDPVNRE